MKDPHKAEEALAMILIALFGASIIGLLGALIMAIKALFN
jgi:preprotein translocase subunit Sss1